MRRDEIVRRRGGEILPSAAVARKEAYLGAGQQWPTGASAAAITTKRPSPGRSGRVESRDLALRADRTAPRRNAAHSRRGAFTDVLSLVGARMRIRAKRQQRRQRRWPSSPLAVASGYLPFSVASDVTGGQSHVNEHFNRHFPGVSRSWWNWIAAQCPVKRIARLAHGRTGREAPLSRPAGSLFLSLLSLSSRILYPYACARSAATTARSDWSSSRVVKNSRLRAAGYNRRARDRKIARIANLRYSARYVGPDTVTSERIHRAQ